MVYDRVSLVVVVVLPPLLLSDLLDDEIGTLFLVRAAVVFSAAKETPFIAILILPEVATGKLLPVFPRLQGSLAIAQTRNRLINNLAYCFACPFI